MKFIMMFAILAVAFLSVGTCLAKDDNEKKREKTHKMAEKTLKELHKLEPTSTEAIQKSAGYAVFNNIQTELWLPPELLGNPLVVAGWYQRLNL